MELLSQAVDLCIAVDENVFLVIACCYNGGGAGHGEFRVQRLCKARIKQDVMTIIIFNTKHKMQYV